MFHSLSIDRLYQRLTRKSTKLLVLSPVLLGATMGLTGLSSRAIAAESVTLQYGSSQLSTSILDLEQFAKTGAPTPQMKAFFQQTNRPSAQWQTLLTSTISVPFFVENFIETPTGRHVLHRIDAMIYPSQGQELKDLDAAITKALANDRTISILEVVQKFPEPNMNLNLSVIERDYQEVKQIVGDINQGNWTAAAHHVLKDAFCRCKTAQVQPVSTEFQTTGMAKEHLAFQTIPSNCLPTTP